MSSRVLIADNSDTMHKVILRSLTAVGVDSVIEAADGQEALDKFKPGAFSLVLTDSNLPNKSGLEVIAQIRAQDATVPIIMVSSESKQSRVLEAIQAGVTDYLVKPFTADVLKAKLAKHGC